MEPWALALEESPGPEGWETGREGFLEEAWPAVAKRNMTSHQKVACFIALQSVEVSWGCLGWQ